MGVDYGEIIALGKKQAIKYGAIQVLGVEANAAGTAFRFNCAQGVSYDVPFGAFSIMLTPNFVTSDGSAANAVDKAKKILNTSTGSYVDSTYLLDRTNHTGNQASATILIDKTGFTNMLKNFTGTTMQDLATYLDSNTDFINGLYVGDNSKEGSFKIINRDSKLYYQRLQNGNWVDVAAVGSYTTDMLNLNTDYSSINFQNSTQDLNLARITSDGLSEQFGDPRLSKLLLEANEIEHVKYYDSTSYDYTIQSDSSLEQSINTFSHDFIIPDKNGLIYPVIYGVELNNTTVGYASTTIIDMLTGATIYQSSTDFELQQGLAKHLDTTGLHILGLRKLIHLIANRQYRIVFKTQNPISFKGGMVNSVFAPYMKLKYYMAESSKVVTSKDVINSLTSTVTDKPLSAKQGKVLNESIKAAATGRSVPTFISVADFNALTSGTYADCYQLTDSGLLKGKESDGTYYKETIIYIINTFTGRAITSSDYSANNSGGSGASDILFITGITTSDSGKTVSTTYNDVPSNESIKSIITDATNLTVTVLWTFDKDNICPLPSVNGTTVSNISARNGSVYTGTAIIDISSATNITATLNSTSYQVGLTKETPPVISSITFGAYSNSQTSWKENDSVPITIIADKAFSTVEIQNYNLCKYQSFSVSSNTTTTINGIAANRGFATATAQTVRVRVRSTTGSWSDWLESTANMLLDNSVPSLTLGTFTYPASQSALKNSETCSIAFTLTKCDSVVITSPTSELSFSGQTTTGVVATRIAGSYNDSINNVLFTLKQNSNGATALVNTIINIANVAPALINGSDIPVIRAGENKNVLCTFDQQVKITSASIFTPNLGTLTTGTLPTTVYSTSYSPSISANLTDTRADTTRTLTLNIVGMSGLSSVIINKYYKIKGFIQQTYTITHPSITETVPYLTNQANLIISGTINTSPVYNICTTYNPTPTLVSEYNYSGTTLTLPPLTTLGVFGYNSGMTITVYIEEL